MQLSSKEEESIHLSLLNEWRTSRSLIQFEMLKQVVEPLIQNEIEKHKTSEVRQEDLRAAAEELLHGSLESYSPSTGLSIVQWIEKGLSSLDQHIDALKMKALSQRGK